jgi:ribosomal-protein-serine acetyltransferase
LGINDAEEIFSVVESNRAYLREWLPWLDQTNSVEDEISFISMSLDEYEKREGVIYAIRLGDRIIGTISINWIDWGNRGCGVGYWLSESHTGRGIVTRCCTRLMEHCFDNLGLHRIVLEVAVENHESRAVADRLGMRLEGITKDREWLYDHYVDAALYAITAPEWQTNNQD